jgi:nucleotide-binding universal stress UspA family protein
MALIHKILIPTDFSEHASVALEYGADLALRYSAPVVVVHTYANPVVAVPDGFVMMTAPDLAELLIQLRTGIDRAAARLRELGVASVETRLIEGSAWHEIVAVAKAEGCDLVVMGTHGRGGLSHALLGSVAEKVVRKAACPVLTVRMPG